MTYLQPLPLVFTAFREEMTADPNAKTSIHVRLHFLAGASEAVNQHWRGLTTPLLDEPILTESCHYVIEGEALVHEQRLLKLQQRETQRCSLVNCEASHVW